MVEAAAKEGRTLAVAAALVLLPISIRSRIILTRSRTDDGIRAHQHNLYLSTTYSSPFFILPGLV